MISHTFLVFFIINLCCIDTSEFVTTSTPQSTTLADPLVARHCSTNTTSPCGKQVTKCQLMEACNCTMRPTDLIERKCSCCESCIKCLGPYLLECCACIGLCELEAPGPFALEESEDEQDLLLAESEMETLSVLQDMDGVFEEQFAPMKNAGWQMYELSPIEEMSTLGQRIKADITQVVQSSNAVSNCTVVYMDECSSKKDCKLKCETLSASSFRWFVTGCCECIGMHCMHTGSAKARCTQCLDEDFPVIDNDVLFNHEL